MPLIVERLKNKFQTGDRMYYLARKYKHDLDKIFTRRRGRLVPLSGLPLNEYFNIVKSLPYRQDIAPFEVVARPRSIIANSMSGVDCKKKGVLMLSYLYNRFGNRIPARLVSVSTRPDRKIHHVLPQIKLNGRWQNLDATYSNYMPFQRKLVTAAEVL